MTKRVALFIAEGSEPIEVMTPVDVLRRGGVEVSIVSTLLETTVTLNEDVCIIADIQEKAFDPAVYDMIIVPGGDPGYKNLEKSTILAEALKQFLQKGVTLLQSAPDQQSWRILVYWREERPPAILALNRFFRLVCINTSLGW